MGYASAIMATNPLNSPPVTIPAAEFRRGMRQLAAGVSVVTTRYQDVDQGVAVTSVASVSAEPPTVLTCVAQTASCHNALKTAGAFCVNILREENLEIARDFSSSDRRAQRFTQGEWVRGRSGILTLKNCMASLECVTQRAVEFGTHTIFIGQVIGMEVWGDLPQPLIYVDGHFHGLPPGGANQ